jgi:hypothetical protein
MRINFLKNIFILFLAISSNIVAQEISWSPQYELPKRTYIKKIIDASPNYFFILRESYTVINARKELWLEQYVTSDMSLKQKQRIKIPIVDGVALDYEELFLLEDRLVLLFSGYNQTDGGYRAYAQLIAEDANPLSNPVEVDKIISFQRKNIGDFNFVPMPESGNLLIIHQEPFDKTKNERFVFTLINNQLIKQWSHQLELPYKGFEFKLSNFKMDKDGVIYMLAKVNRRPDIDSGKPQAGYFYTLLAYDPNKDEAREYELTLKDKAITDIAFNFSAEGDLIAAGFYSNSVRSQSSSSAMRYGFDMISYTDINSRIAGTFFLKINKQTQQVVSRSVKDFDKSFLTEFMPEKSVAKGRELAGYLLDYFYVTPDGGAILAGEQYYTNTICNYDWRTGIQNCNDYYYYNDILVVNINPNGNINWTKKVPKAQQSVNDNGFFLSYVLIPSANGFEFIFNDHIKNVFESSGAINRSMNNSSKAVVARVHMDNDGKITKMPLFVNKYKDVIIRPKIHLQLNDNSLLIYGQRGKSYRFGRIKF